jgi:hypothetical protein
MQSRPPQALRSLLWLLCALSGLQAHSLAQTPARPTQISLTLSIPSVPAGTVAVATAAVSDANGAVGEGVVDLYDGSKSIASLQLVRTSASGSAVGTATLRRVFGPGTHVLKAHFRGTVTDAASSSATVTLTVGQSSSTPSPSLLYADTQDLTVGTAWDFLSDVKLADVNNDGILDIVALQFGPCLVAVALGDPSNPGHFLAPSHYSMPCEDIEQVQPVDLDGDGLLDLVVSDGDTAQLFLFRNNPAIPGTFLAPTTLKASDNFVVLDVNRDGLPDIVTLGGYLGTYAVTTYLNNPASPGQFLPATQAAALGNLDVWDPVTADMNGDGLGDLIYTTVDGSGQNLNVNVMLADPANPGAFLPPVAYPEAGNNINFNVGDLNLDGLADVVVETNTGFDIRLNDASHPGVLLPPVGYAEPDFYKVQIGDVTGDGLPDIVAGYTDNTLRIFYGNGDGTVQSPTLLTTGPTAPAFENNGFAIADVDGDGFNDLVTAALRQNAVQIFRHQVTGRSLVRTATDITLSGTYMHPQNIPLIVTATTTAGPLSGTVEFYDSFGGGSSISIGTAPIVNGTAVMTVNNPALGYHDYELAFHGDAIFAPSESAIQGIYVVPGGSASATTLTASPNPAATGRSVVLQSTVAGTTPGVTGTPSGTIQFLDGTTLLATSTLSAATASVSVSTLATGVHPITAVYSGDSTFGASTSPTVNLTITGLAASSTLALTASPAPAVAFQTIQLQASLTSSFTGAAASLAVPVTFFANGISLGTATANSQGIALLPTSTLASGTYTLTATFAGNSSIAASTSAPFLETVLAQDYILSTSAASITVKEGYHASLTVSLQALGGLQDAVSLSCLNLPAHARCVFASPQLMLGPQTVSTQLTIETDDGFFATHATPPPRHPAATIALAGMAWLGGLCWLQRTRRARRLALVRGLAGLLLIAFAANATGCANVYHLVTTSGSYPVAIAATGEHSGILHQAALALNVTP